MTDKYRCKRCGDPFPITEEYWYKAKNKPSGFHLCWCKACHRASHIERYAANPEKENARTRQWKKENKEHVNRYDRQKYAKKMSDPEERAKYNARMRDYISRRILFHEPPASREKRLAASKAYYAAHADELKAYAKTYYETHKEQMRESARRWRVKNPTKVQMIYKRKYYRKTQPLVDAGLMKRRSKG
jgi:hypothetical protein